MPLRLRLVFFCHGPFCEAEGLCQAQAQVGLPAEAELILTVEFQTYTLFDI